MFRQRFTTNTLINCSASNTGDNMKLIYWSQSGLLSTMMVDVGEWTLLGRCCCMKWPSTWWTSVHGPVSQRSYCCTCTERGR